MPGTMFTEVVSSQANSSRKWYTVPLSLVAHACVFAAAIVIPLVATDVLPSPPKSDLHFTPVALPPEPPPTARVARRPAPDPALTARFAPVEAPQTIGSESGLVVDDLSIDTTAIDGLVEGLGASGTLVEAAPMSSIELQPVRPGGQIQPPTRVKHVMPAYPDIARSARVQGVVIIEAIIGTDGIVANARVIRSIPLLDQAALDAVRRWEYTPTLLNGRPTPVIMTVTVQFALN